MNDFHIFSVHIQENLEDDIVKEALNKVNTSQILLLLNYSHETITFAIVGKNIFLVNMKPPISSLVVLIHLV